VASQQQVRLGRRTSRCASWMLVVVTCSTTYLLLDLTMPHEGRVVVSSRVCDGIQVDGRQRPRLERRRLERRRRQGLGWRRQGLGRQRQGLGRFGQGLGRRWRQGLGRRPRQAWQCAPLHWSLSGLHCTLQHFWGLWACVLWAANVLHQVGFDRHPLYLPSRDKSRIT